MVAEGIKGEKGVVQVEPWHKEFYPSSMPFLGREQPLQINQKAGLVHQILRSVNPGQLEFAKWIHMP